MQIDDEKPKISQINTREKFLHPGEFYFAKAPECIGTLLGSCIAITLWHPELKIGGMCHFVLPQASLKKQKLDGRYATDAMRLFEHSVQSYRTELTEYEAKIFGGGNHLPHTSDQQESIGIKNAEVAMTLLLEKNVNIQVADVGENWARRIFFELETGDVWVKKQ